MARLPYRFSIRRIASIYLRPFLPRVRNFHDLPVGHVGPAGDPQEDEDGRKNASGAEPAIQCPPDEQAEQNAPGHGQAELHYDGQMLGPVAVFFKVEKHSHSLPLRQS